ncbi:MAG: S1 RNA-binding domain-containing protein, partial [Pseudomonadota bacterium]|nr:S1 RNA-binding domain-containing protein [Pseudomonadota bacterium]
EFTEKYKIGDELEGEIRNITEFGLFVGLTEDIDGMVHMSDLDWIKSGEEAIGDYTKGDTTKIKILEIDTEKERISLGIKQLTEDPVAGGIMKIKKGDIVTCKITNILENGIEVNVNDDVPGFIRRGDLSRDRSEQRPDRFASGEVVDALVTTVDIPSRKVNLSIKAREVQEEKIAMAEFGSSSSGASLGDILGAAFKEHNESEIEKDKDTGKEKAEEKTSTKEVKSVAKETATPKKKTETKKAAAKKTTTKKKTSADKKIAKPKKKTETKKAGEKNTTTKKKLNNPKE